MVEPMDKVGVGIWFGSLYLRKRQTGEKKKEKNRVNHVAFVLSYRNDGRELRLAHQAPLHGLVYWGPLGTVQRSQDRVTLSDDPHLSMIRLPLLSTLGHFKRVFLQTQYNSQVTNKIKLHRARMNRGITLHYSVAPERKVCATTWTSRLPVQAYNPLTRECQYGHYHRHRRPLAAASMNMKACPAQTSVQPPHQIQAILRASTILTWECPQVEPTL
jgi:hypothetical protein